MIGRDQLAEAASYNDALVEERTEGEGEGEGVDSVLAELGIVPEQAHGVAFQRGLRALAALKGGDPEVWGTIARAGGLTEEQEAIILASAASFMDGLAAYARAAQTASRDAD